MRSRSRSIINFVRDQVYSQREGRDSVSSSEAVSAAEGNNHWLPGFSCLTSFSSLLLHDTRKSCTGGKTREESPPPPKFFPCIGSCSPSLPSFHFIISKKWSKKRGSCALHEISSHLSLFLSSTFCSLMRR